MAKLKVYRTPIGFHDAYVAAASQKAALQAWGSNADLFARGIAELVTDPALTEEPLAHPGTVIRRSRGTAEEQIAALPPDRPKAAAEAPAKPKRTANPRPKPKPRPSRDALDDAEQAIEAADTTHQQRRDALDARIAALLRERETLDTAHERERAKLEETRDREKTRYDRAIEAWRAA